MGARVANCSHYSSIMTCVVIVFGCISLPFRLRLSLQPQWASLSIIKKWQAHLHLMWPPDKTQAQRAQRMAGGLFSLHISPFFINLSVRLTRQLVIMW